MKVIVGVDMGETEKRDSDAHREIVTRGETAYLRTAIVDSIDETGTGSG
jgi:hypothetical protein